MQQVEAPPTAMVPRVLVFFDYACQFCYLDWPRFKRLRAEHGAELFIVPFELRPELAPEGVPVDQLGGHSERVKEHMQRMAHESGLTLTFPEFVPNTHLALSLGEYGRDQGPEAHEAIHEAIFEAYSGRSENIGERDVLLKIAEDHAFDIDDVQLAWDEGRFDDRIHRFFHLALSMGISATPSALICNELFIGTRPYRVIEESLERCMVIPDKIGGSALHTHREAESSVEEPTLASEAEGKPPTIDR
ncbi:MAG TPA: DsbA family protein [Coriobacteriia bacterium]|nr:DsbA family protein [Coriobacteriia bacterium]